MSLCFHISKVPLGAGAVLTPGVYGQKHRSLSRTDNYSQYVKEELFERVRLVHHSSVPSRLNCVFLFSDAVSATFYNAHWNNYSGYIYEMEILSGAPYEVEMNLLNCNGAEFSWIEQFAHKYWNQVKHSNSCTLELLLNGQAKVKSLLLSPSVI